MLPLRDERAKANMMDESPLSGTAGLSNSAYARECRIRDHFAASLKEERPGEVLLGTENSPKGLAIRADMKTVNNENTVRIWEFKIKAGYEGLGQVLTYLAMARKDDAFQRNMCGVLAAFEFQSEVVEAIQILNLGIEIVHIPVKYRLAGDNPASESIAGLPTIPFTVPKEV
jgi:hypothetical protein